MMIRLMADTWREAVLRPLAMAAPNGWVYTEIVAPDFRFVLALGLALVAVFSLVRREMTTNRWRPVIVLFGLTFLSFVPWMATSGNGRYFMPYLLLIGPLCIGLVSILSCTRSMKASITCLVLGLQGYALYQNNPWNPADSWGSVPWLETGYFSIEIDRTSIEPETTYITVAGQTLALVAPQFPAQSRWVNLSAFNGSDTSQPSILYDPVKKILQSSRSLKLFQRAAPRAMVAGSDQPNQTAISEINEYLRPHRLAIKEPTDCKLLASKSLIFTTMVATDDSEKEAARIKRKTGFWICSLQYPIAIAPAVKLSEGAIKAAQVFEKMETLCPRFFSPGQVLVGNHPAGYSRGYPSSDSSLILTRDGDLYIQSARALNPERIGRADEVLSAQFNTDCTNFKGRAGLPWEREI